MFLDQLGDTSPPYLAWSRRAPDQADLGGLGILIHIYAEFAAYSKLAVFH